MQEQPFFRWRHNVSSEDTRNVFKRDALLMDNMGLKGPTRDRTEITSWADENGIVPVEMQPHRLNSEPACMALLAQSTAETTTRVRIIAWEDFFAKFDELGLTLVYDDGTAFNEILQVDADSTAIPPAYRTIAPD